MAKEVALVANLGKALLAKGTSRSNKTFSPKLSNVLSRNPTHWIIVLDNWTLLSFVSADKLLAKAFFILEFCLAIRNTVMLRLNAPLE